MSEVFELGKEAEQVNLEGIKLTDYVYKIKMPRKKMQKKTFISF